MELSAARAPTSHRFAALEKFIEPTLGADEVEGCDCGGEEEAMVHNFAPIIKSADSTSSRPTVVVAI